jgi:hypothetical protein
MFTDIGAAQNVQSLIDGLASSNKPPAVEWAGDRDEVTFVYPPGYNHDAQKEVEKRVQENWNALLEKGTAALPDLVKHINDHRYSFTLKWGGQFGENWDVGRVCREIIQMEVEIYQPFVPLEDRWKPHFVSGIGAPRGWQPEVFKKWWNEHQKKDLHALQTEAVEWAIEHERRRELPAKEKTVVLASLDAVLKRLKSSDKPIQVDREGKFLGDDATLFKENQSRLDQLRKEQDAERLKEWQKNLAAMRVLDNAHKQWDEGITFMHKGDLDQAIAAFTEAIRLNPQYELAYFNRGRAYRQKGDLDRQGKGDITHYHYLFYQYQ